MENIKVRNENELLSLQPLGDASPKHIPDTATAVSLEGETMVTLQESEHDPLILYPVDGSVDNTSTSSHHRISHGETLTYATLDASGNFVFRPLKSGDQNRLSQERSAEDVHHTRDESDSSRTNTGPQLVVVREGVDGDTMAYIYIQGEAETTENEHELDTEHAHTITLNSADGSTLHTLPASYTQHLEHTYGDLVLVNSSGAVTSDNEVSGINDNIVDVPPGGANQDDPVLLLSVQSMRLENKNNTSESSLPSSRRQSKPQKETKGSDNILLKNVMNATQNQRDTVYLEESLPDEEMATIEERLATRDALLPPRKHRRSKLYDCPICQMTFKSIFQFNTHQSVHKGHNIWHCDICKYACDTVAELKQHKNSSHQDARPYKCQHCELRFPKSIMLDDHVRSVHNKEQPHICSFCNKGFYRPHDLKMHLNIHLKIKSNLCHICGRLFSHPSNLIRHQRLHTGIKPYVCITCGKRFNQLILLHKHRTTHQPGAGVCPQCPSTFRSAAGLKKHYKFEHKKTMTLQEATRIVRGQGTLEGRRFYCHVCGKQFLLKSDLKKHEKKEHGSGTLLQCPSCKKSFTPANMKTHMCISAEEEKRHILVPGTILDDAHFQHRTKFLIKSDLKKTFKKEPDDRLLVCSSCNKMGNISTWNTHICVNTEGDEKRQIFLPNAMQGDPSPSIKSPSDSDPMQSANDVKMEEEEYLVMYITPEGESVSYVMKKRAEGSLDKVLQINAPIGDGLGDENLRPTLPEETIMINVHDRPALEHQQEEGSLMHATSDMEEDDTVLMTPDINSSGIALPNSESDPNSDSICLHNIKLEPQAIDEGNISDFQNISQVTNNSLVPLIPLNTDPPSEPKVPRKPGLRSLGIKKNNKDLEYKTENNLEVKKEELDDDDALPLTCKDCGKLFQKRWNYSQHIATHDASLHRYKCEVCGLTFAYRSTFTSHVKKHSDVQQIYACSLCEKTYKSSIALSQHHKRDHLQLRPFACDICHKDFYSKSDFQYHVRVHNNEHPYICFACGRGFSHISHLHRHERTHRGERPHKCPFCPKEFIQLVTLRIHLKKHEKEAAAENPPLAGNESSGSCAENNIHVNLTLVHALPEENDSTGTSTNIARRGMCEAPRTGIVGNVPVVGDSLDDALLDHSSSEMRLGRHMAAKSTATDEGGAGGSLSMTEFSPGTIIFAPEGLETSSSTHQFSGDTTVSGMNEDCISIGNYLFKKI